MISYLRALDFLAHFPRHGGQLRTAHMPSSLKLKLRSQDSNRPMKPA